MWEDVEVKDCDQEVETEANISNISLGSAETRNYLATNFVEIGHPHKEAILALTTPKDDDDPETKKKSATHYMDSNFPMTLLETPLIEVYTEEDLEYVVDKLKDVTTIGVGFEYNHSGYDMVICFLEISTGEEDYIIDAMALKDHLDPLAQIFTNPKILKIFFHDPSDVIYKFQQVLGFYLVNIASIQGIDKLINNLNYKHLGEKLKKFGIVRREEVSLTDFRKRPLDDNHKDFCRLGSHYNKFLYDLSKNKAVSSVPDQYKEYVENINQMCLYRYTDPSKVQENELVAFINNRHKMKMEVLDKITLWRDSVAARERVNPDLVLSKDRMNWIISKLPNDFTQIMNMAKSKYVNNNKNEIMKIFQCKKVQK